MTRDNGAPDIFLSYSRENRDFAARLAGALKQQGFSVWWDSDIPAGVPYVKYIEKGLKAARCVVVLWSEMSTGSRWVRNEADYAAEKEILVPVLIQDVELPWEFRSFQTLNLCRWNGEETDEFTILVQSLRDRVQGNAPTHSPSFPASPKDFKAGRSKVGFGLWAVAVLAAVAVLTVTGISLQNRIKGPAQGSGQGAWHFTHTPLTGNGKTRSSAISPDGSLLAYTHDTDGHFGLRLKQIDTGRETQIVPPGEYGIRSPVFSPEGNFVYFAKSGPDYSMDHLAEYDVYRVSMLGGASQKLTERILGRRFDVSPDGSRLVCKRSDGDSLRVLVRDIGDDREWTIATQTRDISVRCCLAWSADGSEVYTTGRDTASGELEILTIPASGGPPRVRPSGGWQIIMDIFALADGSGLLVIGLPVRDREDLNLNLYFLPQGTEDIQALTDDITYYYQVSADRSGSRLALTYYAVKRILRVHDADNPVQFNDVSTDIVSNGRVVWTPDGHLLTNQRVGDGVGLVYLSTEDELVEQVATEAEYIAGMDLSPDGETLAYTSFLGKEFSIWISDPHGGSARRLAAGEGNQRYPVFGPDGAWLIYCLQPESDDHYYLHRISLESGFSTPLNDVPGLDPDLSPDGTQVVAAVFDAKSGKYFPALVSVDGGQPRFLDLPAGFQPLGWGRTGSDLVCAKRDEGVVNLWSVPINGGNPRQITDYLASHSNIPDMAWNAARDSFAVVLEAAAFDALLLKRDKP